MTPRLSDSGVARLTEHLSRVIESKRVPAAFFGVANVDEILYYAQDGLMDIEDPAAGSVTEETVLHLFSMTKLVTSVACLRFIDRGLLPMSALDDPAIIDEYLPELSLPNLQILEGYDGSGKARLRPAINAITLRMLLNHTSGAAYPSRLLAPSPGRDLGIYARSLGKKHNAEAGATYSDIVLPLIFEPGSSFAYSLGLDHIGVLLSRLTGKSLEQIFQDEIFQPLGLPSLTFYPTAIEESKLMKCTAWDGASGQPKAVKGSVWGRATKKEDVILLAGGSGLYGTLKDYLRFLQAILKCQPRCRSSSNDSYRLLLPRSFDLLFQPSLVTTEQRQGLAQLLNRPADEADHSLGFVLDMKTGKHGRKKGTGSWYGAAQTHFWIDPESGIAAVCGTQIVDAPAAVWLSLCNDFEAIIYDETVASRC